MGPTAFGAEGLWSWNGYGRVSFLCSIPSETLCPDGALEGKAVSVRCFTSSEVIIMLHPLVTFRLFWAVRVIHRRGSSLTCGCASLAVWKGLEPNEHGSLFQGPGRNGVSHPVRGDDGGLALPGMLSEDRCPRPM